MSDEQKSPDNKPAEEEKGPEPGTFGKLLEGKGVAVTHLGPDGGGIEVIEISGDQLLKAAEILKTDGAARFDLLITVAGVDMKEYRLSTAHLYSTELNHFLMVQTPTDANERVPSLMPVWPAANWHEREAYDLYGIEYTGHKDLRRILMPNDWLGHPLRKDYVENDPRLVWNKR